MAVDNSAPRNGLILLYTCCLAVATLIALEPLFSSYYAMQTASAQRDALSKPTQLLRLRSHEDRALQTGLSIDEAINALALRGRASYDAISPRTSSDLDALKGWAQLPKDAPVEPWIRRFRPKDEESIPQHVDPEAAGDSPSPAEAAAPAGVDPAPAGSTPPATAEPAASKRVAPNPVEPPDTTPKAAEPGLPDRPNTPKSTPDSNDTGGDATGTE